MWFICTRDNINEAAGYLNKEDAIQEAEHWLSCDPDSQIMLFKGEERATIYMPKPKVKIVPVQ